MTNLRLFASDLDNTMFVAPEGPDRPSLEILEDWLKSNSITISYVSGRSFDMVMDVIAEFDLPMPDYVISSVGTSISHNDSGKWRVLESWRDVLRSKWSPENISVLKDIMSRFENARVQPDKEQGEFKQSYRIDSDDSADVWDERIQKELKKHDLEVSLIVSRGAEGPICVDFLPAIASKSKAIEFLAKELGITKDEVAFSGDSGNDEDALTCGVFGILVGGAEEGLAEKLKHNKRIYCANSPQVKGILEGLRHFRFMQACLEQRRKEVK